MKQHRSTLILAAAAVTLLAAPAILPWSPRLVWNASASAPIGLYLARSPGRIERDQWVAVRPPEGLAAFLDERGYLPRGVPLIKRVLALPGTEVCRSGDVITVGGAFQGQARAHDRRGRALPVWQGCQVIPEGLIFLMNPAAPDSLDGRYFGPLPASAVTARLIPLWTDAGHGAGFTWRADWPPTSISPQLHPSRKDQPHATDR